MRRSLLAAAPHGASAAEAALRAAIPTLLGCSTAATRPRGLHSSALAAKVEKPPYQTASSEGAQQPFVEGDTLAEKRKIRESYEGVLHEKSGTAEDVGVLDQAQSSLGKMTKDPRQVDQQYAQAAREGVVSHGGRERETEDEGIADAVFDQTRSDKGYDENANRTQPWESTYAKKPTSP